jgi:hypothetical protein
MVGNWWGVGAARSRAAGQDWRRRGEARQDSRSADRLAVAASFATELCDLAPVDWLRRSTGSTISHLAYISDDPELADVVAEAWDLARSTPPPGQVQTQSGVAGMVVIAHGDSWSVVAPGLLRS